MGIGNGKNLLFGTAGASVVTNNQENDEAAAGPLGVQTPVVQGIVNVVGLKLGSAARRQAEAADGKQRVQIEARRVQNTLTVLLPCHSGILRAATSSASCCIEASRWSIKRRSGRGLRRAKA